MNEARSNVLTGGAFPWRIPLVAEGQCDPSKRFRRSNATDRKKLWALISDNTSQGLPLL